ncbi:MAG TPA: translocation/assembly module TamB domain-containing protein, partial [Gemmatimonadaceae bacterium]
FALSSGGLRAALRARELALADVRPLYPPLPDEGGGSFALEVLRPDSTRMDVGLRDLRLDVAGARLEGSLGGVLEPDSLALRESRLQFTGVTTELIERLVPGLHLPLTGSLTGSVTVAGPMTALGVNANATLNAAGHNPAAVGVRGTVGVGESLAARDLVVTVQDAPVSLVREFAPDFPLGGEVDARATVSGSTTSAFRGGFTVTHALNGDASQMTGTATVTPADSMRMDVQWRFQPLSLAVASAFAGEQEFRGDLIGTGQLRGTPKHLDVQLDVQHVVQRTDSGAARATGRLEAHGEVDLARDTIGYVATIQTRGVDLRAVMPSLPATALTGVTRIEGRGTDPATLRGRVSAEFRNVVVDSTEFVVALADLRADGGMLAIDTFFVDAGFGSVVASGTLGLVEQREGRLDYRVEVTALNGLQRWLASYDTTAVPARPGVRDRLARLAARADSIRLAQLVDTADIGLLLSKGPEALAQRRTAIPEPVPLPRDSLAGEINAEGRLTGNIRRFDVRGQARLSQVVAAGNEVGRGTLRYAVDGALTPDARFVAALGVDSVRAAGFALDSTRIEARHQAGSGEVTLAIFPGDSAVYRAAAEYVTRPNEGEVRIRDLAFRFDSATWAAPHPATIRWAAGGLTVDSLELRTVPQPGVERGRIFVNGALPAEEAGRLDVVIDSLRLAPWLTMLQSSIPANGLANVRATVQGTQRAPRMEGTLTLVDGTYERQPLPRTHVEFAYNDRRLRVAGQLRERDGYQLAQIDGSLPIDLSFGDSVPNRLIEAPLELELTGDPIPLAPLSQLTEAVGTIVGSASGRVRVEGTWDDPSFAGAIALRVPSMQILENGTVLTDGVANLRLAGDTIVIDSLVARSGGRIRGTGFIEVSRLDRPVFNLRLDTDDARIAAAQYGELTVDAQLGVNGPLDTLDLGGTITITRGVIYLPEPEELTLISTHDPVILAVLDSAEAEALDVAPGESPFRNALIDIDLHVERGTWARGRDANIEIYGNVHIERDTAGADLAFTGTLLTDQGDYEVYGRRFTVTRGSVGFTGGAELDPVLQILARYEVRQAGRAPFDILVTVGGTLRQPTLTLTSTAQPTLTQSDMISFLAFGRSSSSLLEFEGSGLVGGGAAGSSLAGNVAALATRQLAGVALGALVDEVQTDLAEMTRADVVDIRPADLPADLSLGGFGTLLRGTEIQLGKYLDRNTFASFQVRPTLAVPGAVIERRLSPQFRWRVSLETRFLPERPTLTTGLTPTQFQVFGTLLRWTRSW